VDEKCSDGSGVEEEVRSIARLQAAEPVRLDQSEEGRRDQARRSVALREEL
jgi:hypothetical protein